MAISFDISAATAVLKELYDGQPVNNEVYKKNPHFAMVKKMTDFEGKNLPIPIQIGVSQGRSVNFQFAQTNQTPDVFKEFFLTRAKDYSIATIQNEVILAMASDKGSFIRGAKAVIDGALRSATLSAASKLFRNGLGSIDIIFSIATGVITLTNPQNIVQMEVGQTLTVAATDGGAVLGTVGYVIAVNRSLGQFTVSAVAQGGVAGTPAGWVAGQYFGVQGDMANGGPAVCMSGLDAWLPNQIVTPVTSTAFFGVDRSTDPTRLAGVCYDGTSQTIEEALTDAISLINREGGSPDIGWVNHASYAALKKSLGSRVQYNVMESDLIANISFKGVLLEGDYGQVTIMPDRNCLPQTCFLLQNDTWELSSLGDVPRILEYLDGFEYLRVTSDDAAETRCGMYGNLGCNAPGWNGRVLLSA